MRTLFAMTYDLKKWKLAFTAILLQILWQKFYTNVPWVVLYKTYLCLLLLPLNLFGSHGNQKAKFVKKKYKKINSLEAVFGIKLKLCRIVSNSSLYKNFVFFIAIAQALWLLFLLTYSGKSENWDLLLSHCRYFDKSFAEMFVEWSSTKQIILDQTSQFDWLPWQPKY